MIRDRYRMEQPIARGGMGEIWSGWDVELDRPVAIKLLGAAFLAHPELRARFDREAKAAAKLRTPHVVQMFAHGELSGTPYIVMELLEGEDLGVRLKREKRLPIGAVARIVLQAAKALRRAHESGIVHRDLKPQNLFLARADDDEVVKVLDFGIAKRAGPADIGESTKTGELLGSPHYMSPEQARGLRNVDHRSDLWSLGVIAYRALTGDLPFRGEAVGDLIYKICSTAAPAPSQLCPELPPALDRFFAQAFSLEPGGRHQSATDMAAAFVACAGLDAEVSVRLSGSHELALATPIFSAPGARPEGGALTPPSMPSVSLHGAFSPPSAAPMPAPPGVSRTALLTTAGVSFAVALAVGVVVLYARSPGPSHAAPAGSAASPEATVAPSAAAAPTADVSVAPAPSAPVASAAETASPPSAASAVPTTAPRPAQIGKTGAPPPVAPPISPNNSPNNNNNKKKKAEWGY